VKRAFLALGTALDPLTISRIRQTPGNAIAISGEARSRNHGQVDHYLRRFRLAS
jgi:hypothetical protein